MKDILSPKSEQFIRNEIEIILKGIWRKESEEVEISSESDSKKRLEMK